MPHSEKHPWTTVTLKSSSFAVAWLQHVILLFDLILPRCPFQMAYFSVQVVPLPATSLPHYFTTTLYILHYIPHGTTTALPHSFAIPHCCITSLLHYLTTALAHYCTSYLTPSLPHCCITSLLHYLTTALPHYCTSYLTPSLPHCCITSLLH